MLTLAPESACDICAEGYDAESLPHSIPCGHTFCRPCLDKVCETLWSPRTPPACPLCREPFAAQHIRLIRIDVAPSASYGVVPGFGYPHSAHPYNEQYPSSTVHRELGLGPSGLGGRGVLAEDMDAEEHRVLQQARMLEDRVSKAAQTRCSFEELSALQREIEEWLQKELVRRPDNQHASLRLSAALLGAILVNGFAYNEAKKTAKGVEVTLKDKLEQVELVKKKLEIEIHRHRTQYTEKLLEVQQLKQEMSKMKGLPPPPPISTSSLGWSATPGPSLGSALALGPSVPLGSALGMRQGASTPAPHVASRSATPGPQSAPRSATPGPAYSGYSHFPRQHTLSTSGPSSTTSHLTPVHSPLKSSASSMKSARPMPVAQTTSYLPTASMMRARSPERTERHERWLPNAEDTPPRESSRAASTSRSAHAYSHSYSAGAGGSIPRPRTAGPSGTSSGGAGGWGRGIAM